MCVVWSFSTTRDVYQPRHFQCICASSRNRNHPPRHSRNPTRRDCANTRVYDRSCRIYIDNSSCYIATEFYTCRSLHRASFRDVHRDIWADNAAQTFDRDNSSARIDDAIWDDRNTIARHNLLRRSDPRNLRHMRHSRLSARISCRGRDDSFDSGIRACAYVGVSPRFPSSPRHRVDDIGIRPRRGHRPSAGPAAAVAFYRASFRSS